jgi:hypothetical protein
MIIGHPPEMYFSRAFPFNFADEKPGQQGSPDGQAFHVEVVFCRPSEQDRGLGGKLVIAVVEAKIDGDAGQHIEGDGELE